MRVPIVTPPKSRGTRVEPPEGTLDIALSLAAVGWPVFPVSIYEDETGKRHKVPAVKWKAEATTDADTIRAWWTGEHRHRWIGVYAGAAGIVVLDLDPAKGDDPAGAQSLEAAGLEIPKTFTYPSHRKGGRHHVYRAPDDVELTIAKGLLPGVDVRSGAGLMVYYGPRLDGPPRLAPAPEWLLVKKGESRSADRPDRGVGADESAFRARLADGKPDKKLAKLIRRAEFPPGAAHEPMLLTVTALVEAGVRGMPGIPRLLDETRERYVGDHPDRGRDWDNALAGSIRRLGLPPVTLELSKVERKEIARRNLPEVVDAARKERRATLVFDRVARAADGELSDDALAEQFATAIDGRWINVPGMDLMRYDGVIWSRADEALLIDEARIWLRGVRAAALRVAIERGDKQRETEAKALGSKTKITAVARLAAGILLGNAPVLDADPDVLNVPNGVVDLRTGELRKRRPEDYFTRVAGVEYIPGARSADWDRALQAVPPKVARWLQIRLGQGITGRISTDKAVPFCFGGGDNGKSAVLGAARAAAGSSKDGYAVTVPEKLLLGGDSEHPTELMTLYGARLAVFEELPRGGRLNAQRLKLLSGTNELSGRFMRADFVTFPATHTLVGSTNHLPVISDVDDAVWERVAPVLFPYKFVKPADPETGEPGPKPGTNEREGDPGLRDRLAEAPQAAVLAWLVEGAIESYRAMPRKPKSIRRAADEWRGDSDPVLGFVLDNLVRDPHSAVASSDLYTEFGRYLEGRGQVRWQDATIAMSFMGHSALEGIEKRQMRTTSPHLRISRPAFTAKPIPQRTTLWVGVRFRDDWKTGSEAERDAQILAELERQASR